MTEPATSSDASMYASMSVGKYLKTRVTSLKPPLNATPNPFKLLRQLTRRQWAFVMVGWLGWMWDAFDFFAVSLTAMNIAKTFDKSVADVTWGITLVLMLRSVGAVAFGMAADRWGRRWTFVADLVLFIVLQLATGFCPTFSQFLAVRALYGIAMGGLFGICASTALEDCPRDARGIVSGFLQQGYTTGFLLATVFARPLVPTTSYGWRSLFWFSAGPPVLIIAFMLMLPETETWQARRQRRASVGQRCRMFMKEYQVAITKHWVILIYLVLLMAGFNFMSHGSQDLYPTLLQNQYGKTPDEVTVIQVLANIGAFVGGTLVGFYSQVFGRRLSIIVSCIIGGALLYPYGFTSSNAIIAAAFFEQFFVQGAWSVVPIHLTELSPPGVRTLVVGTAYQLGNLVASASSTIEATIGEMYPLPPLKTSQGVTQRYEYGKVICIFMACVYAYTIIIAFLGPEWLGRPLDIDHDDDLKFVGGESGLTTQNSYQSEHPEARRETRVAHPPARFDFVAVV